MFTNMSPKRFNYSINNNIFSNFRSISEYFDKNLQYSQLSLRKKKKATGVHFKIELINGRKSFTSCFGRSLQGSPHQVICLHLIRYSASSSLTQIIFQLESTVSMNLSGVFPFFFLFWQIHFQHPLFIKSTLSPRLSDLISQLLGLGSSFGLLISDPLLSDH